MSFATLWPDDPSRQARWEQLLSWLDPRPGELILDVGCGRGRAAGYLAARVGPYGVAVGLERLPGCLAELGRNAGKGSARGVCGDALALPFADAIFDAVLSVNVLEAVPDRPLALAEMRRVLKPGGRIVLAHDDYESAVYAGTDRELTRRVVRAYADSTFASYAASDGQMGRHLWGHFSRAGFVESEIRVLPLVDVEYREPFLGWSLAQFDAGFVAAANDLTQLEIDRWHAALAAASARGDYLFCLNLYVCLGRKPLG